MIIPSHLRLVLALALATGCTADDADADDPDTTGADASSTGGGASSDASSSDADASSSTGPDLYACEDTVMDVRPLSGPGYDPMTGVLDPMQAQYVVSTTQILPRPEVMDTFLEVSGSVTADLDTRDGVLAYALGFEPNCGFLRTLTIWRDEEAMYAFAVGDAHITAVGRATEISATSRVTHFTVDADELPLTWEEAATRLDAVTPFH